MQKVFSPPSQKSGFFVLGVPPLIAPTRLPIGTCVQPSGIGPNSVSINRSGNWSRGARIPEDILIHILKTGRAGYLGLDRFEINELGFEDRSCHCLQRLVHSAVQLDFVVEGTEDICNIDLYIHFWICNFDSF